MVVLVSNAASSCGVHLCQRLLEEGSVVIFMDRDGARCPSGARFVSHDTRSPFPESVRPERVYHFLDRKARGAVDAFTGCVDSTKHALQCAKASGARALLVSSGCVYGEGKPRKVEANIGPVTAGQYSPFRDGVRASEALALASIQDGSDVCIARLFNVYGVGVDESDGRVVHSLLRAALSGGPMVIHGCGEQMRAFCYSSDAVNGLMALMSRRPTIGPINIGGRGDPQTVLTLATMIREVCAQDAQVEFDKLPLADAHARLPDLTLAHGLLKYDPSWGLRAGIEATVRAWKRSSDA